MAAIAPTPLPPRVGRILGVDAIILGSVTRYDLSDRTTGHSHSFVRGEAK